MLNRIQQLREKFEEQGTIMSFSGAFSQGIIEEVGEAIKIYVNHQEEKDQIPKIFSVFIEMTQNIKNYSNSKKESIDTYTAINSSSVILIGKNQSNYYISSVNLVENKDVEKLVEKIEAIINLDKNELKAKYKEVLRNAPESDSGAGLGFIDMARKSSEKINYKIEHKDNKFSYFYLEVKV